MILMAVFGAAQLMLDGDPATTPDWNVVAAGIVAGYALINARDAGVSSERSGAD